MCCKFLWLQYGDRPLNTPNVNLHTSSPVLVLAQGPVLWTKTGSPKVADFAKITTFGSLTSILKHQSAFSLWQSSTNVSKFFPWHSVSPIWSCVSVVDFLECSFSTLCLLSNKLFKASPFVTWNRYNHGREKHILYSGFFKKGKKDSESQRYHCTDRWNVPVCYGRNVPVH